MLQPQLRFFPSSLPTTPTPASAAFALRHTHARCGFPCVLSSPVCASAGNGSASDQCSFAQRVDRINHRRVIVSLVAEVLAHMRPVPLLHMRVVVRAIRARAREQHGLGSLLCPRHNRVVDEFRAVVAVHAQQGKWETRLQIAQLRQCAVLTTVFQRALFRPVGADVHRIHRWRSSRVPPRRRNETRKGASNRSRVRALTASRLSRTSASRRR